MGDTPKFFHSLQAFLHREVNECVLKGVRPTDGNVGGMGAGLLGTNRAEQTRVRGQLNPESPEKPVAHPGRWGTEKGAPEGSRRAVWGVMLEDEERHSGNVIIPETKIAPVEPRTVLRTLSCRRKRPGEEETRNSREGGGGDTSG